MLIRERILARLQAVLSGATPAGARVFRSRRVALEAVELPAIVIEPGPETTSNVGSFTDRNELPVDIVVIARGDPFEQLTAPVEEAAHRALMADPDLALLVSEIRRTGATPQAEEADRTQGAMALGFRITYLTRAGDPSLQP